MHSSLFEKIFPTPRLLTFPSVGLDISDKSIKFAELVKGRNGFELGRYGTVTIPEGVIVSGKIVDQNKLVEILKTLKKEQRLHTIRVSLPEEQMYLFELSIPQVPRQTIRQTIELSIDEHIPIKVDEVNFDYSIREEKEDTIILQVCAIPKILSEEYLEVFHTVGLQPISFELEAQAVARAVIREGDMDTIMMVDFGETRTGISVATRGMVMFSTTLNLGGAALTESLVKTFSLSFKEAEQKKRDIGLSRKPEHREFFSVLLQGISILRDEINKNFIYWHTRKDEKGNDRPKIAEIILCGGNANLRGLAEYLSASLRIKVTYANPWVNVNTLEKYVPPVVSQEALRYVTAFGLALRDFDV